VRGFDFVNIGCGECIKHFIASFTPRSNVFAMFIEGVHLTSWINQKTKYNVLYGYARLFSVDVLYRKSMYRLRYFVDVTHVNTQTVVSLCIDWDISSMWPM